MLHDKESKFLVLIGWGKNVHCSIVYNKDSVSLSDYGSILIHRDKEAKVFGNRQDKTNA